MIKITKAQLLHRSAYELIIAALWGELQDRPQSERNTLMQTQFDLVDLYRAYNSLSRRNKEIDEVHGLSELSLSFEIDAMLERVIKSLKFTKTIKIPVECKDDPFLRYFSDKIKIG